MGGIEIGGIEIGGIEIGRTVIVGLTIGLMGHGPGTATPLTVTDAVVAPLTVRDRQTVVTLFWVETETLSDELELDDPDDELEPDEMEIWVAWA